MLFTGEVRGAWADFFPPQQRAETAKQTLVYHHEVCIDDPVQWFLDGGMSEEPLWPSLRAKIDAALADGGPMPAFAEVVDRAAQLAGEAMDRRWVLVRESA